MDFVQLVSYGLFLLVCFVVGYVIGGLLFSIFND